MENKEQTIHIRMDKNLYKQLKKYADRNDEGMVSMTARRALKLFLNNDNMLAKNMDDWKATQK